MSYSLPSFFFFLPFFDAFTFSCSEFSWYSAEVFEHQHLCSIPFYIRQTSCLQVINVLRCMRSVHSTFRNKTSQDYTTWGLCVDAWTLLSGQNYSNPVYFFFTLRISFDRGYNLCPTENHSVRLPKLTMIRRVPLSSSKSSAVRRFGLQNCSLSII